MQKVDNEFEYIYIYNNQTTKQIMYTIIKKRVKQNTNCIK